MKHLLLLALFLTLVSPLVFSQDSPGSDALSKHNPDGETDMIFNGPVMVLDKTDYKIPDNAVFRFSIEPQPPKGEISPNNIPDKFMLGQNYPNPFNPSTTISFGLTEFSEVSLNIYSMDGKLVKELVNGQKNPGVYKIDFDASGLASGMYIYKLTAGGNSDTKKMILIK